MPDKVQYAVERFPDLDQAIKQCCADNRFFRSLCEDYGEAVEVLRGCEDENDPERLERCNACRELVAELEREILQELEHWVGE
ncbi:hypothetical protein [Azospirillum rugosum]|uniref:Uncharacterized protein n=1 Tax=Azospirillum rugosum TaxID=416170 RepID=A0ABS4STC8_9PROT|nr:hypothetical protein [Azospirillum rugosum]MBP2295815.1 hypothetical protein [Azospirillum rugosum]MDQ0529074.1 hypothetical protein [Azospirillum rugosum]